MAEIEVQDNPQAERYEARVDGELAGFAAYRLHGDRIVFTHTEVDEAFEGKGVGGALARGALDDVRAKGTHRVTVLCPFISAWLKRHPDYQDLVAD
jgi:predicted GNAT family acetyltransferase